MSIESGRAPLQRAIRAVRGLALRYRRFIRFLFVGFGNTLVGYGLFVALFLVTQSHRFSLVVATVLGVLFNFFTTGRIVFGNRRAGPLLAFLAGYAVTLSINFVLLETLVHAGVHALLAQAVTLPVVVVLSYLINSRFVFRPETA